MCIMDIVSLFLLIFCYNHQSALQNEQFVSEAIDELVTVIHTKPHACVL